MIIVFRADSRPPVAEAGLVLAAVDIDHEIHRDTHGWALWVAQADQARAHEQLMSYWAENQPDGDRAANVTVVDSGWPGVLAYLGVIWSVPALQSFTEADLLEVGRLDAEAVMSGELWRTMTALTLHADFGHIAANSLFGTLFGLFVGRYLGSGLGWLLVLLCGTGANLLNATIQQSDFRAIGASTATFAALGLVPAFGWRRGYFRGRGFKRGFAPIFGAIAILTYTGFGGENVDVGGHLLGFVAGLCMGLAMAHIELDRISQADQLRAGIGAAVLLFSAWWWGFAW